MKIDIKGLLLGFLKEIIPELIAEQWGISTLKKILGKGRTATEAGSDKGPEIKYGGLFNLSDETAFLGLLGRLITEPDCAEHPKKITDFINQKLSETWQKRRFRVIICTLANYNVRDVIEKITEDIPAGKNTPAGKKETVKENYGNFGMKFLKYFGNLEQDEMMAVCEAAGILDSTLEKIESAFGPDSTFGKSIQDATAWMKQDIERRKASSPTSILKSQISGYFCRK